MCWFADILDDSDIVDIGPCDGPVDRCHLIPKQRIKRALGDSDPMLVEAAVWHPFVWVEGCRRHHANFDNARFTVSRSQLPPGVEWYAEVMDLGWSLDHDFGGRIIPLT